MNLNYYSATECGITEVGMKQYIVMNRVSIWRQAVVQLPWLRTLLPSRLHITSGITGHVDSVRDDTRRSSTGGETTPQENNRDHEANTKHYQH
jgi:hypothetical protein